MSEKDRNIGVVNAYVAAFNRGDIPAMKSLFAPDAQIQGVLGGGLIDKASAVWQQLIDGLAIHLTIEGIVADGNTVVVRLNERGIFRAPFFGVPPTGKSYELVAMEWFDIRDGLIQSRWAARDAASQARQIGLPL
jgi:steroid delta-isomerase-like uncharacterized protein